MNTSEFLGKKLDDSSGIDDDLAYQIAHDLWMEISSENNSKGGEVFTFIEYLKLIQSRAEGFVFKVASSKTSTPRQKRLLGVLWQTATMRRNFELFGQYISMDMKRGINKLRWPYCVVTMNDESKKCAWRVKVSYVWQT
ncbi:hypothetical protein ACHAWF_000965 [Thalassiosira exigua]